MIYHVIQSIWKLIWKFKKIEKLKYLKLNNSLKEDNFSIRSMSNNQERPPFQYILQSYSCQLSHRASLYNGINHHIWIIPNTYIFWTQQEGVVGEHEEWKGHGLTPERGPSVALTRSLPQGVASSQHNQPSSARKTAEYNGLRVRVHPPAKEFQREHEMSQLMWPLGQTSAAPAGFWQKVSGTTH